MKNSYNINIEQLLLSPDHGEMLVALGRGLEKFSVDFYLVGAVARNVWMQGIHNLKPRRTTTDIDFAVLINKQEVYNELKQYLVEQEGFEQHSGNAFVLLWKGNMEVDLLPFGAIEDAEGKLTTQGMGLTSINLHGFIEVYEEGLPEINLGNEHKFKCCTLPGIVLLKLIAWDDRPEHRRDDVKDISDIMNHFFDMYDDEIWENHNDLFGDEEADLKLISARVMGREMKKIAVRNKALFSRIEKILNENTEDYNSRMASIMAEYYGNIIEENIILLQHLKTGFNE